MKIDGKNLESCVQCALISREYTDVNMHNFDTILENETKSHRTIV